MSTLNKTEDVDRARAMAQAYLEMRRGSNANDLSFSPIKKEGTPSSFCISFKDSSGFAQRFEVSTSTLVKIYHAFVTPAAEKVLIGDVLNKLMHTPSLDV